MQQNTPRKNKILFCVVVKVSENTVIIDLNSLKQLAITLLLEKEVSNC